MSESGIDTEGALLLPNTSASLTQLHAHLVPAEIKQGLTLRAKLREAIRGVDNDNHFLSACNVKWGRYPNIHQRVMSDKAVKCFLNNMKACRTVVLCQKELSGVDISLINDIIKCESNSALLADLSPAARNQLKQIHKTADVVCALLTDMKEAISDEDTEHVCYSKMIRMTVGILVAGIVISISLYMLPIVFPAVFAAASQAFLIARGVSLGVTCVGGILSIYEAIKKCHEEFEQNMQRRFVDDLSQLCDYLKQLRSMNMMAQMHDNMINAVQIAACNNAQEIRNLRDELKHDQEVRSLRDELKFNQEIRNLNDEFKKAITEIKNTQVDIASLRNTQIDIASLRNTQVDIASLRKEIREEIREEIRGGISAAGINLENKILKQLEHQRMIQHRKNTFQHIASENGHQRRHSLQEFYPARS